MEFKRQTYSGQIVQYIRESIRRGSMPPGTPVKESILSKQLGISRAPIREALQILTQEGLVEAEPQKARKIRSLSPKEIKDSYVVGGILEAAGVSSSLHLWADADMQELFGLVDTMLERVRHNASVEKLADLDDSFHAMLLKHCDNHQLVTMAHASCPALSKCLYYRQWLSLYTPQAFYERHRVLAEAIRSRDITQVEKHVREHYTEIGQRLSLLVL